MDRRIMIENHLLSLSRAMEHTRPQLNTIRSWGHMLAGRLGSGGRLLVCGNGGSAAEAQHLTAELVGRFRDERQPLSAIALHAETSSLTAIVNDYGNEEIFARGVRAHGRDGDVLLALSTSGASRNVLAAVKAAREQNMVPWALTGPAPNPLAASCDDAVSVEARSVATVQEMHLVLIHALCASIDEVLVGPQS